MKKAVEALVKSFPTSFRSGVVGKTAISLIWRARSQCGQTFSMPLESLHVAIYKCALLDFTGKP